MFKKNIVIGIISSFVPIILLSYAFGKNNGCNILNFKYPQMVRMLLIMFIIINVLAFPLFKKLNIKNYFIIGAILSVIYSSIGRFSGVPQQLLKMNPNKFQFNALILWTLFYGLIIKYLVV